MSFYSIVKTAYKKTLPKKARRWVYLHMPNYLKAAKAYAIRKLEKYGGHDDIYDKDYYESFFLPEMLRSHEGIAEGTVKLYSPKFIVDVGCGPCVLLSALTKRGVLCRGLDYSSAALNICRQNGLDVIKFDLEHDILPKDLKADVVVSTEVAEHLPGHCADRFVSILCSIADDVVMTAAEPARTWKGIAAAHDHVNEQPKEYWIDKFENNGFKYNKNTTALLRTEWEKHGVLQFFVERLMVFRKE